MAVDNQSCKEALMWNNLTHPDYQYFDPIQLLFYLDYKLTLLSTTHILLLYFTVPEDFLPSWIIPTSPCSLCFTSLAS